MSDQQYRVIPEKAEAPYGAVNLTTDERREVQGVGGKGCVIWLLIFVGVMIVGFFVFADTPSPQRDIVVPISLASGAILATIVIVVLHLLWKTKNVAYAEELKRDRIAAGAIDLVERDATRHTKQLRQIYDDSINLYGDLSIDLDQARQLLRQAKIDFSENAISPFWDSVEGAATHLAAYQKNSGQLAANATKYYQGLRGKNHTFPSFPVQADTAPDPTLVLKEFHKVVRKAQTNYHFTNIWEQRRTRKVLIEGFHSLGEAVNGLSFTIEASAFALRESISSDIAIVIEEQIQTRDSIDKTRKVIDRS